MKNIKNLIEEKFARIENLLLANKNIFTFEEAANYAGLSYSAFYKLTSAGAINVYKPGGKKIFIKKEDLETYLLTGRNKSKKEMEIEAATYVTLNGAKKAPSTNK